MLKSKLLAATNTFDFRRPYKWEMINGDLTDWFFWSTGAPTEAAFTGLSVVDGKNNTRVGTQVDSTEGEFNTWIVLNAEEELILQTNTNYHATGTLNKTDLLRSDDSPGTSGGFSRWRIIAFELADAGGDRIQLFGKGNTDVGERDVSEFFQIPDGFTGSIALQIEVTNEDVLEYTVCDYFDFAIEMEIP
jgi:hypothetical protein